MRGLSAPVGILLGLIFPCLCVAGEAGAPPETPPEAFPEISPEIVPKIAPEIVEIKPFFIFISFSLPKVSLHRILRESERTGAVLVLRGPVENSLPRTAVRIRELLEEVGPVALPAGGPAWMIDPIAYRRFSIEAVPVFLLCLESLQPCRTRQCPVPRHVRLSGDLALDEVLKRLAEVPAARSQARALQRRLEPRR